MSDLINLTHTTQTTTIKQLFKTSFSKTPFSKTLLFAFILFSFTLSYAFEINITNSDTLITIKSPKNFTNGKNTFNINFTKGNKPIQVQNLAISFFMPEMPGMPKMTESASIEKAASGYLGVVNLPHGGTWQIRISYEDSGILHKAKSSIDF